MYYSCDWKFTPFATEFYREFYANVIYTGARVISSLAPFSARNSSAIGKDILPGWTRYDLRWLNGRIYRIVSKSCRKLSEASTNSTQTGISSCNFHVQFASVALIDKQNVIALFCARRSSRKLKLGTTRGNAERCEFRRFASRCQSFLGWDVIGNKNDDESSPRCWSVNLRRHVVCRIVEALPVVSVANDFVIGHCRVEPSCKCRL